MMHSLDLLQGIRVAQIFRAIRRTGCGYNVHDADDPVLRSWYRYCIETAR